MKNKLKVFYIASHPVQYHVGIYRELAKVDRIVFKVIYQDDVGLRPRYEKEFKHDIQWDIDLLSGYKKEFMKNYSFNPMNGFFSRVNFGLFDKILFKQPDVIIFTGYVTLSDWLILFLAKSFKVKLIWRGEAVLKGYENSKLLKYRFKKIILKYFFKLCDAIMFSCKGNKEYLKFYGVEEEKLFFIPCAVDNCFFKNEKKKYISEKTKIKAELKIEQNDLVILFSARFTTRKRPFDLLKALKKIDNSNLTILFVGDGLDRKKMEHFAKNNNIKAIFTGFMNQTEISKYYTISDIGVVISDYDPSPKSMNEIMNFELPIIVTNVVGTAYDLIEDEINGFIVNVGDIESIAEKINYFNNNRESLKIMGKKSFDIVQKWNFKQDVNGILDAIEYIKK
jgi:glycosyltransferase involved in cell wall biosynthesis